jgi:hypothetical protein
MAVVIPAIAVATGGAKQLAGDCVAGVATLVAVIPAAALAQITEFAATKSKYRHWRPPRKSSQQIILGFAAVFAAGLGNGGSLVGVTSGLNLVTYDARPWQTVGVGRRRCCRQSQHG